jgi:hypothetical protein
MNCCYCHDRIVGKPGNTGSKSSGGWCGSRRVTRRWAVCQDCYAAGEYEQHLYRLRLQAELRADIEANGRIPLEQGSLF